MDLNAVAEVYDPFTVDRVKGHSSFDNGYVNGNKAGIIKLWAEMLPANSLYYIKAWLMETKGFWNWGTENWVFAGNVQENDLGISGSNQELRDTVSNKVDSVRTSPVIRNIFSISLTFWTVLFYVFIMIIKKRPRYILPVTPLLALWGTMMTATPVYCEFRYAFALHISLPFLIITMFYEKAEKGIAT